MSSKESTTGEAWLTHAPALRALAAALTNDATESEDLVQETWLRALRRGEFANRPRAWWSAVLRNLARDRAHERRLREHKERQATREERMPSELEVLERLDIAQRVTAELTRLDEPYRSTIHLRYFEGLAVEEIARRSNAPVETVRARLRRGLGLLRERMDRACGGDRSTWGVALAAIALHGKPVPLATVGGSLAFMGGVVMSMKVTLGVAAAIAIGLGVYLLRPSSDAGSPKGSDVVEVAGQSKVAAPLAQEAAQSETPSTERVAVAQALTTPSQIAAPDDGKLEVRGSVVIVDENGVEHRKEAGTFLAMFGTSAQDVQQREMTFENGAWSLRIPKGNSLGFATLVSGGRTALLSEAGVLHPGPDPIELRGRWLKRGRLRVLDAITKRDLRDIELRYSDHTRGDGNWTHPGDSNELDSILHFAASPFDLPERTRVTEYWLHVAGYAWTRVDFDHLTGGERTVELVVPASVNVSIKGAIAPPGALVRLYPSKTVSFSKEAAVCVHAAVNGATTIDDLTPGEYVASIEVGEGYAIQRLGEAPVVLEANTIADVTIEIELSQLEMEKVHLFGTLALPAGIDVAVISLVLLREGDGAKPIMFRANSLTMVGDNERVRAWDAGDVRVGTWGAQVTPVLYRQLIRAETPGQLRVEISVPELVSISIEVADEVTSEALAPDDIAWSDAKIEGMSHGSRMPLRPHGKKGTYELSAPAGVITVSCNLTGYASYQGDVDLRTAEPVLHIKLHRASGVHLEVFEGDARLRVGFNFFDSVRCTAVGERRPVGIPGGRDTEFEWTRLLDPGRYTIKFPELDGYEQIEPVTIEVESGQTVEVPVHVKRKQ